MPSLSNSYNIKYKTRNFAKDGIKGATKLKHFKNHTNLPPVMIGSKTDFHMLWDFLSVNSLEDTTFVKSGYSHENRGWEAAGTSNFGPNIEQTWTPWLSYDNSKTYIHRIIDHEGNTINETFGYERRIRIDNTMSLHDEGSYASGTSVSFTGTVVGDADFTYQLRIEYENESIPNFVFDSEPNPSLGNLYDGSIYTLPTVSQVENADFVYEVTWEDGQVQREVRSFTVYAAPQT